jgi:hypothetical protein
MKIETNTIAPPKTFNPVTVSITFDTQDELGVLTQFFGGLCRRVTHEVLEVGSKRYSCDGAAAKFLVTEITEQLYDSLREAYEQAAKE